MSPEAKFNRIQIVWMALAFPCVVVTMVTHSFVPFFGALGVGLVAAVVIHNLDCPICGDHPYGGSGFRQPRSCQRCGHNLRHPKFDESDGTP